MAAYVARWRIALYAHAQVNTHVLLAATATFNCYWFSGFINVGFIRIYIFVAHLRVANNAFLLGNNMHQVGTVKIFITQHPEDIIDDRSSALDVGMSHYHTCRFKAGEGKFLYIFFQWHTILQTNRNSEGKAVHQRAESSALFVHVHEDLAQSTIFI